MTVAEKIDKEVRELPGEHASEVLDFIGFLEDKDTWKPASDQDLQQAQASAMPRIWDNPTDDEVWNDL